MKNTLTDLNNYLFETLEKLLDEGMTDEQLQREITRSQAVTTVAESIIKNGELALKAARHVEEYGLSLDKNKKLPPMLEAE
jgi:hypothetical protein